MDGKFYVDRNSSLRTITRKDDDDDDIKRHIVHIKYRVLSCLQIHASLEDCHKYIDPKLMPKEYGGVMPMKEMIGMYLQFTGGM